MTYITTIDQSKRLIELGLNPATADMMYNVFEDPVNGKHYERDFVDNWKDAWGESADTKTLWDEHTVPCRSVGALMDVWPKDDCFCLSTSFGAYQVEKYIETWCCDLEVYPNPDNPEFYTVYKDTLFDAVYEMTVYLLEHKYIN